MLNTTKSEELYKVALDLMPGGVNSPVRAFGAVGRNPLFIDYAKGSYVYDVDGNKFIDYVCSWGPGILGHSHPEVLEEVVKACFDGLTFGAPTGKENELAQLVKDCVPSMEMMRMVSSGTEATMSAIRAARGFTGRDKIIKFKGCYHGHSDGLLVQAGSAALTQSVPDSSGVPASFAQQTLVALYNDKAFWVNKEATSSTYVAAINEEPVVPEYDYTEVVATITSLDEKIAIIKHALNVTNSNEKVQVGDAEMSIDTILIKMAQLNKRKSVLDQMRKQLPKAREEQRSYMSRNTVPEYRYINYDLELIKKEYEAVSKTIMEMQMALDKYNQTVQFEVDI